MSSNVIQICEFIYDSKILFAFKDKTAAAKSPQQ
jgi:hypothetical protein